MPTVVINKSSSSTPEASEPSSADPKANPQCKHSKMKLISKIFFFGLGSVVLILGLLVTGFWQLLHRHILESKLILANSDSSESFKSWSGDSVPVYFKIYPFNITNSEEVLLKGEKPHFDELGPYTYRISQIKEDITWNDNGTVTFLDRRRWDFIPEQSTGSLEDRITNINAVAATLVNYCRNCKTVEKIILNNLLKYNEHSPFSTYTAKDVLFDGGEDKMLALVAKLKKIIKPLKDLPDKFAWYFGKNISESNVFNVFTGAMDIKKLGLLHAWNYKTRCKHFDGDCDLVRGSLGDLWPINAAEEDRVRIFISDFCSDFALSNIGSNTIHELKGTKFEGTKQLFDSNSPESSCYCPGNKCDYKPGVRNVTACLNAPIFVSFPHFYHADASYRDAVDGMNPSADKHTFHLTLQQDSGILVDINARLQINVLIDRIPGFDFFPIPKVMYPVLWFEEMADIPPSLIAQLQFTFNKLPKWLSIGGLILTIIGTIILVSGLIISRLNFESIPYTRRLE